jgi:cytochrome c biogenesis protein CcmG, thiol:disulfide interchange protein DsbE
MLTALRHFRTLVLIVLALGAAWIAGSRLAPDAGQAQPRAGVQVGMIAPAFTLRALDSQAVSLSSQRGNVVLLNLWASWCSPCRAEMPGINRIFTRYRDAGFVVLAVNATSQDDEVNARSFVQSLGLTFPVLLDHNGSTGATYRLRSLPTSYFIGRDGVIREVVVGSMTEAMLEARVKRLLAAGQ